MKQSKPLLLGSQSPFRKKLLEQVGLQFQTEAPRVDEDELKKTLSIEIEHLPLELAKQKAASLVPEFTNCIIVGSDQMATFDKKPLRKPANKDEAFQQLKLLSGNTHVLRTALAVWDQGEWYTNTTLAKMKMRTLSDEEIKNYIEKDDPVGCAGGYKIESLGPVLFDAMETSDYYSIIGIPLLSLCQILRSLGISTI